MNLTFRFYTQPGCQPCLIVKPALTDFLARNQVAYEEVNIFDDIELAKSLGIISTPGGILYDGNTIGEAQRIIVYEALEESKLPDIKNGIEELTSLANPPQQENGGGSKAGLFFGAILVLGLGAYFKSQQT